MTTTKSSPTPKAASAPDTPTNTQPENVPEVSTTPVSASEASPTTDPTPVDRATLKSLVFPLALTILAILPLALGIGAVRLKAATSSAKIIADELAQVQHDEEPPPPPRLIDRRLGDQQFLERRYEVALQYFRALGSADPNRLPPELLYRIGLCQEGLGLWDEAMQSLSGAAATTDNPVLNAAAVFGQARIWLRSSEPGKAASLLRSLEVYQGSDRLLPINLSQEIAFLTPIALAHVSVSPGRQDARVKPVEIGELFVWSLESALAWTNGPLLNGPSVSDATAPANVLSCRINRPAGEMTNTLSLNGWTMDARGAGQSRRLIIESIASEAGWKVDWSDLTHDQHLDHVVNIAAENRPLSLILTVICSELQATWIVDHDRLIISRSEPDEIRSRQMIAQTLKGVMDWNPNHRLIDHCRFALAELAQNDRDLTRAATLYSSLVGRDSSRLAVRAAYNAGTLFFQTGDFARACFQLGYVVNGAPGHDLHAESLILMGRLLLDLGETQDAVFQFRRATEARNRPDDQARAAAYLGLALLMQDKYQEAAEAIFVHKLKFTEPAVRNLAALVTTYARWKSLPDELKEQEASFMYRALVAAKSELDLFGQTSQLLMGRVYSELGFDHQMAELYTQMLGTGVTENVEPELVFSLARYEQANGREQIAKSMWTKLVSSPSNRWANRARWQLAEVDLNEGRPNDCLKACEQISPGEGVTRKDLLKLRGRAYERLGDEVRAARCYAGQMPTP